MTCLQLPRGKGKMLSFWPKNFVANFIPKKFGYQPTNILTLVISVNTVISVKHFNICRNTVIPVETL